MSGGRCEFHRPARVYPAPVERDDIEIPAPPQPPATPAGGLIQALLPVLGGLGMFGFAIISGDRRHLVMAAILASAMLLSGILARTLQMRQAKRRHLERSSRYRSALAQVRTRLIEAGVRQRRWSRMSYPSPIGLWPVVVDRRRVWERRLHHDDFMRVRIGTGPVAPSVSATISSTVDPMSEVDPELAALAEQLVEDFATLDDEPVLFDLGSVGCLAVIGSGDDGHELTRSIVLQLATFRAPDDLRLVVAHAPEHALDWSWALRLPHTASDGGHLVTADPEDLATVLRQISRPRIQHLEHAASSLDHADRIEFPRVVVIIDDYDPDDSHGRLDVVDELMPRAATIGMTFICVVVDPSSVPSEAGATITIEDGTARAAVTAPDSRRVEARILDAPLPLCAQVSGVLQPLRLRSRTGRATTIDSAGLVELLGIGDPSALTPDLMWLHRSDAERLSSPIGVAEDGTPVVLDLKEASAGGMGPHGMLIGATGSGKSELLRTLILGMAARHEPEELAFVLVDFKGGATFAHLDRLPHSAGMITNLERDPSLVDRMLEALHGEVERRQRVLLEAGGFDRADEYQAHRRAHPEGGLDPLPALLVVVDEFGELLAANPDFADLFSTIGRLGRSLGLHLLLCTQRLEDGRIRKLEGHIRYRLCLRTFTAEESIAVIGSKAASELPPIPGVGYLKVDGAVTPFKAGLVSRPLRGSDQTEMEHVVAACSGADMSRRGARPVWLEPLAGGYGLEAPPACSTPSSDSWLTIPVGWEDDPRRQEQRPFTLDFTGSGGNLAIVGGPRTGKSTMLQTLIASAALTHDPRDVQFYALDLGGGGLHLLDGLPHVGAVLSRSQRAEATRVVRRLHNLAEERAQVFRDRRITDMAAYHLLRHQDEIDDEMGEVFLVIDNWGAFCQDQSLDLVESASELIGSGLHHGIHVVIATPRWQDVKPAVRDHIGGRFEFRLGDVFDSEIDRVAARSLPTDMPGRGLGTSARHVQVALPRTDRATAPGSPPVGVEHLVESVRRRWATTPGAAPVRVLPDVVQASDLPPATSGLVLGLEEHRLGPWTVDPFGPDPHMLVLGDAESGKTNLLQLLIDQLCSRRQPEEVQVAVVDYRRRLVGSIPESHLLGRAATPEAAALLAGRVSSDLTRRALPDAVGTLRHSGPALVVVIDDYDLVAGATGNPLNVLIDLVAHGRDLGLHLVIARRVGGMARSSFEPLLQRVKELGTPGVVLGGDPHEGPVLGAVRAELRPPGRGVWVSRGRVTEVQAGWCEPPHLVAPVRPIRRLG